MRDPNRLDGNIDKYFTAQQAVAKGSTYKSLERRKANGLARPLYGIYVDLQPEVAGWHPHEVLRKNHLNLALAHSQKIPSGHFYSHYTSAIIWGLPVTLRALTPLWTSRYKPQKPLTMQGVNSHSCVKNLTDVTIHNGIPVTSAISTWIDLATRLPAQEAIALGDSLLHQKRMPGTDLLVGKPLATKHELEEAIMRPYRRERPRLLELLDALSTQSASAPETHLRLFLCAAGHPPERLDFDVYTRSGRLIGCSEIAYPSRKIVFEYEGDHHRTQKVQWYRDIEKYNDYREAGWSVVRVTADLLYRNQRRLHEIVTHTLG